jgi:hypothetical protein
LGIVAGLYFIAHLPFLAPSLEDIDSINFALGLREFNPAEHQPHPPGYPLYVAAGRMVLSAVQAVRPELPRLAAEALSLSLLSVIAGALAVLFAGAVFRSIAAHAGVERGTTAPVARWATLLLAVCPLFWLTGARPLSDMPGLAAAFASQALTLSGRVPAAAFLAGCSIGLRSQTMFLTVPLLAWCLVQRQARAREWARALALAIVGGLCWGIPLLLATGGLEAYVAALGTQAREDFAGVDMLWATPTPRRLAFGLFHTLALPWAAVPLAVVMLSLGVLGGFLLLVRERSRLVLLLVAFAPYAAFHLVFQETITVRYALPIVAPVAFVAARSLVVAGRGTNFVAAPLAAFALLVAAPGLMAYAADPHPAFRAIDDARRRAEGNAPAMVTSHYELRRPLQAAEPTGLRITWAARQREWLELVKYWQTGGRQPVWFLANPRRTDLALIDPHSRTDVVRYRWAVERRPEVSGTRPAAVDWYRLQPPMWFLGEGWSLTAETGGIAEATGTGPDRGPIVGWVRCQATPMQLMIGGGHLGEIADGPVELVLRMEETVYDRWTVRSEERSFLRFLYMREGCGVSPYARLTVTARGLPRASDPVSRRVRVAIRQFDVQPATRFMVGFGPGWHEDEYAADTGLRWRWASERAVLRVRGPAQDVRVRIRGESPLRYFDAPPTVTLSGAGRVFGRIEPTSDFEFDVTVPADAAQRAGGDLVLETSRSFVPAETQRSSDTRRLGLRIFDVRVERAR